MAEIDVEVLFEIISLGTITLFKITAMLLAGILEIYGFLFGFLVVYTLFILLRKFMWSPAKP
jgi:hypothetical protein